MAIMAEINPSRDYSGEIAESGSLSRLSLARKKQNREERNGYLGIVLRSPEATVRFRQCLQVIGSPRS
jgi:hypothetical protein